MYRAGQGVHVALKGGPGVGCAAGTLTTIRVERAAPPTLSVAWCADHGGLGSPMVTTTDGQAHAVVWAVGAEGDNRLHAFDGDTGEALYASEDLGLVRRYQVPIAAGGRIYVAADDRLHAFRVTRR